MVAGDLQARKRPGVLLVGLVWLVVPPDPS